LGSGRLHFLQYGHGGKLALAFHGYAGNAAMFASFSRHLQDQYTIIAVDLPFQGKTVWPEGRDFTREHLITLVHFLLHRFGTEQLSLIGYSIGGRVCLQITELLPECVDRVTLIASDGLTTNFYYYLLTRTLIGRFIFEHSLKYSYRYMKLLGVLRRLRLINPILYRFVVHNINTEEKRHLVLSVWTGLSGLLPDHNKLKQEINKYAIPIRIFMGRNDKIIPAGNAVRFADGLNTVQLITLKKGHRLPDETNMQMIAESLL